MGALAGTLLLASSTRQVASDLEPNGTFGQPQDVGSSLVGQRLTIFGGVTAGTDAYDGYRLRCPQRVLVQATLSFSDPIANDLALLLFDPTSLQIVETFPVPAAVSTVSFVGRATFDLVVAAIAGASTYQLDLAFGEIPAGLTEREGNDTPAAGQYTGSLYAGESLSLFGSLAAGVDLTDVWLAPFPLAATLEVDFRYPSFMRFDLEVLDGTAGLASPTPLATFDGAGPSPRLGSLPVAAGRLLVLRVRLVTGAGGSWQCHLAAKAPSGGTPKPGFAAGPSPAPLAREAERVPGLAAPYGVFEGPLVEGEVLVSCSDEERGDLATTWAGGEEQARQPHGWRRVRVPLAAGLASGDAARATLSAALALDGAPGVRRAEVNRLRQPSGTPNDTYVGLQWHYDQIHLPEAWDLTTGSSSVIVAVIDTGITAHPDLVARLIGGYDFVSDGTNAADGGGMDGDPTDSVLHSSFHGTHVAGTIGAATNNGSGVAGVTWATRIMPLRALGRYGGSDFDIAQAILFAARMPNASGVLPPERAHVMNMSLGGGGYSVAMGDACTAARNAGVVIVAAAGNDGQGVVSYPGANAGVLAVGATDALVRKTSYSNWGADLDLMAPGGDTSQDATGDGYGDGVLSTLWDDYASPPRGVYGFYNGTSMAAPHVAGVAALILGVSPTLTPAAVESILLQTTRDLGTAGWDATTGWGLVDAYRAVQSAMGTVSTPPQLDLDVALVDFGAVETQRDFLPSNLGSTPLTLSAPVVETTDGNAWLGAALLGPATATLSHSILRLSVDRTGRSAGGYAGRVTLGSNGGTRIVEVRMSVLPDLPPLPTIPLRIFLRSTTTGQVVRTLDVDANATYAWSLPSVPVGSFLLTAGTDLDHDGAYDDDGEYVGAWPTFDQPQILVLQAGESLTGLKLEVFPRVALDGLAAPPAR